MHATRVDFCDVTFVMLPHEHNFRLAFFCSRFNPLPTDTIHSDNRKKEATTRETRRKRNILFSLWVTHARRNLKKHWKHSRKLFSREAEKSSPHAHRQRDGKWEKHETRALIFLCAWGKGREDDAKVFRKTFPAGAILLQNSLTDLLPQRQKKSFFHKFFQFSIFFHIKSSACFGIRPPSLKHEMELQKCVCVLVCFVAALRPIISSPSHRIIMAPSGCIERSFASGSDREGECGLESSATLRNSTRNDMLFEQDSRNRLRWKFSLRRSFFSLSLLPFSRSRLCEDFSSADLSSARSSALSCFPDYPFAAHSWIILQKRELPTRRGESERVIIIQIIALSIPHLLRFAFFCRTDPHDRSQRKDDTKSPEQAGEKKLREIFSARSVGLASSYVEMGKTQSLERV